MSFVKKAVKKVFKVVKKVVKSKAFKIAAIVGLSLFTAGIAAGGFAGFSAAMSAASAAGASGLGSFFSAVGTTTALGWSSTIGALATGTSATMQAAAPVTGGGAVQELPGVSDALMAAGGAPSMPGSAIMTPGTQQQSQNWIAKAFGPLLSPGIGGDMLRGGLMAGIGGYFRGKERERQEFYYENRTVYGNKAFGSDGETMNILQPKKVYTSREEENAMLAGPTPKTDPVGPAPVEPAPVQVANAPVAPTPQPAAVPQEQGLLTSVNPSQPQPTQQGAGGGVIPEQLGVV